MAKRAKKHHKAKKPAKKHAKKHSRGRARVTKPKKVMALKNKKPKGWFAFVKGGKVIAKKAHSKKGGKVLGVVKPYDRHSFYYVKGNNVMSFRRKTAA